MVRFIFGFDKYKAEDIQIIGIRDLTIIADYFVIANGTSADQVKSLADYLEKGWRAGITLIR